MTKFKAKLLFTLGLGLTCANALSDPRHPKDLWRDERSHENYVLFDFNANTYVETLGCVETNILYLVEKTDNEVRLMDRTRQLDVLLDFDYMWTSAFSDAEWHFLKRGTFDTRKVFTKIDARGVVVGEFFLTHSCNWIETFFGGAAPIYFKEENLSAGSVFLYDRSRNLHVRLDGDSMWLAEEMGPSADIRQGIGVGNLGRNPNRRIREPFRAIATRI